MSELLALQDVSFSYGHNYLALSNISVSFQAGERVAVLGGNGAGKSTFFLCCNGVLRPQQGRVIFDGQEVTSSRRDVYRLREGVGLVFQDPDTQIIAGSVASEVSFGPMNLGLTEDEVSRRVTQALAEMNISHYHDYAPQYLSGGEKKRVSIADIIAMRPRIILLDEPTASLDPVNARALEDILNELNSAGITIVISTHDVDFAYRMAERAIVFAAGEIIADASIDAVFADDAVLVQAGLNKPLLYAAYEYLSSLDNRQTGSPMPRTIEEFKQRVASDNHFDTTSKE